MTTSWWFLGVSVYGALYTLNAHRPLRFPPAVGWAFFAHWLTTELAAHHLVWQVAATGVFAALGAFGHWPGWVGLAITVVSWAGLVRLITAARGVEQVVEDALVEGLGAEYRGVLGPDAAGPIARMPRSRLALPFYFKHRAIRRVADLPYGPHGRRNRLDVWHHRDPTERAPVLLWVHGGGWAVGHKAQQALPMITHMTAQGWVCVSPNYRLSPRAKWPQHIVDVKRAIAWTRANIAEYGGDPDFILISGGSAGGHLCALAALTPNDPEWQPGFEEADTTLQGCVAFYGVYDFTNRLGTRSRMEDWGFRRFLEQQLVGVTRAEHPDAYAKASPLDQVGDHAPPFLVIHGSHDLLAPVADAREFASRLRGASTAPVAYAELPGAQHAFDVFHSLRATHVVRAVERFAAWVHVNRTDRADRRATA